MRKLLGSTILFTTSLTIIAMMYSLSLSETNVVFLYQLGQAENRQLGWIDLNQPQQENVIGFPDNLYSIEINNNHILAITKDNPPQLYVKKLSNVLHSGAWDFENWQHVPHNYLDHNVDFDSIVWSPDGTQVAIVDINRDIVLYNLETGESINLGQVVSSPMNDYYMVPSVWSPDSQYLLAQVVTGFDEDDYPIWESVLFSRVGELVLRFNESLCNPIWSPDGAYIASEDWCNSSRTLRIQYVFPLAEHDGLAVPSSIVLDLDGSTWWSEYRTPIWLDNDTLVVPRLLSSMTLGLVEPDELSPFGSSGIVSYDLETYSETLLVEGDMPNTEGSWFTATGYHENIFADSSEHIIAYNPITQQKIIVPDNVYQPCAMLYFRIEADGRYFSILDTCGMPSADRTDGLRIYTSDSHQIHLIEADATTHIFPLGFVTLE